MHLPRFSLRAKIRACLLVGSAFWVTGQFLHNSPLVTLGEALLAPFVVVATVLLPLGLIARLFHLFQAKGTHPAQQGAQPDSNKPGDSSSR
jgi:hypothetical protein